MANTGRGRTAGPPTRALQTARTELALSRADEDKSKSWIGLAALVASAGLALLSAFRLLAVSGGSPQVAYAIVSNSSIATVSLAALTTVLPVALPAVLLALVRQHELEPDAERRFWLFIAALLSFFACAYILPRATFLFAIVPVVVLILAVRLWRVLRRRYGRPPPPPLPNAGAPVDEWMKLATPNDPHLQVILSKIRDIPESRYPSRHFAIKRAELIQTYTVRWAKMEREKSKLTRRVIDPLQMLIATAGAYALFTAPMWIPAENVSTTVMPPTAGYTLKQDAAWTTLLMDNPRQLRYLRTPDIRTREFCTLTSESSWLQPLSATGRSRGEQAACAKPVSDMQR